ncbi:Trp biosynthesis-associated membrane protein [Brachybacterium nesterenkovii]|uniref:Tryptophan-associated membrane protein n=1 Tax=Brachybacterium nesterenkovii TaxID=47847 RepID=A0A1X6X5M1_9MICO|nr:Trp biosynthesis-associated membrane protein [Brachybacterium nesterenkovii]SLM94327.1 Tryptophan-associated membrane protein [Brachybacterium nesterenkovii]
MSGAVDAAPGEDAARGPGERGARSRPRLTRRSAVLAGLVLAGALLLLTRAPWMHARVSDLVGGTTAVDVSGAEAAPLVVAAALVALAASAVVAISSRAVRFVSGPLLVAAGIAAALGALAVRTDPEGHARSAIAEATGVSGAEAELSGTLWPLLALLPCAGLALLGAMVLVAGRTWVGSTRYAREGTAPAGGASAVQGSVADEGAVATAPVPPASEDPAALWDALSRGEDPTAGPRR